MIFGFRVFADLIASLVDTHIISKVLVIMIGETIPFLFIPMSEKDFTIRKNHIVIGDHEDVKKDLDNH